MVQKLEILQQLKSIHGERIDPELTAFKYCQSKSEAWVELYYNHSDKCSTVNLNIITDIADPDIELSKLTAEDIILYFNPLDDVVDNAIKMIEIDPYSIINCIDGLFTEQACLEVNKEFHKNHL